MLSGPARPASRTRADGHAPFPPTHPPPTLSDRFRCLCRFAVFVAVACRCRSRSGTQGTRAAEAKAAEEVKRARSEVEATRALLEEALREKEAAMQEKAAGYALLRTEQGKGGESDVCFYVKCGGKRGCVCPAGAAAAARFCILLDSYLARFYTMFRGVFFLLH